MDVAIVAYLASDFAAFQHERRRAASFLPPELDQKARRLAERAQRRELALFVGAGVSMSAGLPSWEDLLRKLTTRLQSPIDTAWLGPLDRAELLSRELADFASAIKEELEPPMRVGLSHLLLVGLGCEEVVTTNFDMLDERAAEIDWTDKLAALPWDPLDSRRPWLLKMHGDIEHDGSIVLTCGDFIRYESHHGPSGAVLQSLMLSRHLLVVGASLTDDDNFLRLAYEVDDFMATSGAPRRKLGTVLSLGPEPLRQRLYDGHFQYVDTSGGGEGNKRGRELAIFLDALGMYSSVDSSFLLDPRYEFLLDEDEESLVGDIAALLARIERSIGSNDEKWRMLGQALRVFGAHWCHYCSRCARPSPENPHLTSSIPTCAARSVNDSPRRTMAARMTRSAALQNQDRSRPTTGVPAPRVEPANSGTLVRRMSHLSVTRRAPPRGIGFLKPVYDRPAQRSRPARSALLGIATSGCWRSR